MSNFWNVVLNIVIFLVGLSIIVTLHELGHLIMAKTWKVYCYEFSIGFGPKLFRRRFKHKIKEPVFNADEVKTEEVKEEKIEAEEIKEENKVADEYSDLKSDLDNSLSLNTKVEEQENKEKYDTTKYKEGETYFAIRALPLGGYVAMAGEDGEEGEDGVVVPKERTLNGVNHAKQISIMLAGITMNFIVAFLLFLISFGLCPQQRNVDNNQVTVTKNSLVAKAGLETGDRIIGAYQMYVDLVDNDNKVTTEPVYYPQNGYKDKIFEHYISYEEGQEHTDENISKDCIVYSIQDVIEFNIVASDDENLSKIEAFSNLHASDTSKRYIYLKYIDASDNNTIKVLEEPIECKSTYVKKGKYYIFEKMGVSNMVENYRLKAGESWYYAAEQFRQLFVRIYHALGSLFTPAGWKNMGGIISVYKMSAQGVASGSIGYFFLLWGYISLNLGCFNLLPFPGLDGWQTLMALIETISRRKLSSKFKNIANSVGTIVLLVLAGILVIKDIVHPLL